MVFLKTRGVSLTVHDAESSEPVSSSVLHFLIFVENASVRRRLDRQESGFLSGAARLRPRTILFC